MSSLRKFLLLTSLLIAFALALPAAAQDATPFPGCGEAEYPAWASADGDCTLNQALHVETAYSYPAILNDYPFAKTIVMQYFRDREATFWSFLMTGPFVETNSAPWTLQISGEPYTPTGDLLSVVFTEYAYTGGAHPNTTYTTFTFDLVNERQLLWPDLLADGMTLEAVAAIVQPALAETLTEMTDPEWLATGTAPTPENYANFALTADGLLILFPPYQVAAYAAGPQQMTLPYSDLDGILKPEYLGVG